MADKKFSSVAGPRQTKQVAEALNKFQWRGKTRRELHGVIGVSERASDVVAMVTGKHSEAYLNAYDRLGEKYEWSITRENYRALLADIVAATAALVLPVDDHRITPEAAAKRDAENAAKRQAEVDAKVNELRRANIDGFFPTPDAVIDRMLDEAAIEPGHRVLEPSAGIGSILDKIRERHGIDADAVERMFPLEEILSMKGYNAHRGDFLEYWNHEGEYDRIVMNPPFERGADVKHVQHAFKLLKPGGRLVALMANGAAFAKAADMIDLYGWSESLGTPFDGRDAFNSTGVMINLVVLDKPIITREIYVDDTDLKAVDTVTDDWPETYVDETDSAVENEYLDPDFLAFLG